MHALMARARCSALAHRMLWFSACMQDMSCALVNQQSFLKRLLHTHPSAPCMLANHMRIAFACMHGCQRFTA